MRKLRRIAFITLTILTLAGCAGLAMLDVDNVTTEWKGLVYYPYGANYPVTVNYRRDGIYDPECITDILLDFCGDSTFIDTQYTFKGTIPYGANIKYRETQLFRFQ